MRKYIEKEVIEKKEVVAEVRCDVCRKKIINEYLYEVTTSHNDWGNDSWESLHIYDICSDECLSNMVDKYLKDKSNTKKMEIEMIKNEPEYL